MFLIEVMHFDTNHEDDANVTLMHRRLIFKFSCIKLIKIIGISSTDPFLNGKLKWLKNIPQRDPEIEEKHQKLTQRFGQNSKWKILIQ